MLNSGMTGTARTHRASVAWHPLVVGRVKINWDATVNTQEGKMGNCKKA